MTQAHKEMEDERKKLRLVLQETRYVVLQYIIGHPKGSITLEELNHLIPDVSESTLHSHLSKLKDAGIVERKELAKERRQRDLPHVFYGLSDEGEEFLERHSLLEAEETLREFYEKIEKSEKAKKYEMAPRP